MHGVEARARLLTAVVLLGSLVLAGCSGDPSPPKPSHSQTTAAEPTTLTFGVWGSEDQPDPFKPVVDTFNSLSEGSDVTLRRYASHDDLLNQVEDGGNGAPDVF